MLDYFKGNISFIKLGLSYSGDDVHIMSLNCMRKVNCPRVKGVMFGWLYFLLCFINYLIKENSQKKIRVSSC